MSKSVAMNVKIAKNGEDVSRSDSQIAEEIAIMGEDNRPLYNLKLKPDGSLEVHTYMAASFEGQVKDTALIVEPKSTGTILINRKDYK